MEIWKRDELFFAFHPNLGGKLAIIVDCPGPRDLLIRPWFKPLVDIIISVTHVFSGYDLKFDPPLKKTRHPCSITMCLFWKIICFICLSLCGGPGFNFGTGPWLGSQRLCNNHIIITKLRRFLLVHFFHAINQSSRLIVNRENSFGF